MAAARSTSSRRADCELAATVLARQRSRVHTPAMARRLNPDAADDGTGDAAHAAYRLFHDLPFIGLAVTDGATKRWRQVNTALCDMLGRSRDELLALSWDVLTHADDLDADVAEFERVLRGETEGYKQDKRFLRPDGATVYASIDVKAVRKPDGVIDFFVASIYDITGRVEAESAARRSADLLENLGQQVPGMIYQYLLRADETHAFPYISNAVREIFEVEPDEARADAEFLFGRIHPEDVAALHTSIVESADTLRPWQFDFRVVLPRQGMRWRRGDARPQRLADGNTLWHGFVSDITDRQLEREVLLESEQRFRAQIEHATRLEAAITSSINGVAMADLDGTLRYANKALLDLWGYTHATEAIGRNVSDFWAHPDETARTMAALAVSGAWTGEMTAVRADGEYRLFQVNASFFPDPSGHPVGMLASFADITERRRTEERLRIRDEAIRTAVTAIAIGDPFGRPTYVNPAFIRLWGYDSEAEVLALQMVDFLASAESLPDFERGTLFRTGAWQGELKARRKNGSVFDMLATTNVVRDDAGVIIHLMGSFLDITESKRLQAEVLQAQKMESVGRLAGGVAHDFNNLLTVMKGCLGLALDASQPDSVLRNELLEINRAADSAAELTRQLLAFSRKQIIAPRILDLNDVAHRVHGMLVRLLGEDIRLQVVTAPGLGAVRFDQGQAEQILVNLAVNARDAMPHGGRLTLETSNVRLDDEYARAHRGTPPGDYILLAVSDTGLGMNEETRAHVFEPFFTTKEIGQGTGLGLAMIHGAVSQNGGRVEVYSELGHGTSFKIFLPRVSEALTATPAIPAPSTLPRGTETVVLVEDDSAVRQLIVRLLERQGYRVFSFAGGALVLEWLETWTAPIHLLLTDVIMPGMNGKMLAEHVRTVRPEIRVLYASGYTANVIVQHGVLKPGVEFLAKPFTAASLATTVRELLDRA